MTRRGGLLNFGATCYLNTIIQCLTSCDNLANYILSNNYKINKKTVDALAETKLANIFLVDELRQIMQLIHVEGNSIAPKRFAVILQHKFKDFLQIAEQNDIHEMLLLILSEINNEIHFKITPKNQHNYFSQTRLQSQTQNTNNPFENMAITSYKEWYNLHKNEYSELVNIIYNQYISQIICGNCKHIHHKHEFSSVIDLEIPSLKQNRDSQNNIITLNDCFKQHIKIDEISDWRCDVCNKKPETNKKTIKFWKFAPSIIISLKRFRQIYNPQIQCINIYKNNTNVDVPFRINMQKYVVYQNLQHEKEYIYNLDAFAIHLGSSNNGHYVSVVRNNNQWLFIDDTKVRQISDEDCKKYVKKAYMLFYNRIET